MLKEVDQQRLHAIVAKLASFGTRHTLSSQTDPNRGIGAARDWIFARMQALAAPSNGRMTVELQSFTQPVSSGIPTPTVITNVVTTLHGSEEPDRIYVVTGHYDSRVTDLANFTSDAPGADDDASGVANVMELIRIMATRESRATIVMAAVAGEEQGVYGSTFLAQQFAAAKADIQGMFSNDIVGSAKADDGTVDPHALRLFAEGVSSAETPAQATLRQLVGGESDSASRQLARFASSVASNSETDMAVHIIYRRDRYLRGSDHIPFLRRGYPAGRFTEPHENFAHQHQDVRVVDGVQFGDLIEFVDFAFLRRVTRVNMAVMWSLANGPGTPKNAEVNASVLTNTSSISWDASSDTDVVGYEIVWRPCTEPDWTNRIPVGNVTSVTVPLTKDNLFLGVRAVDKAGRHSPVAFPTAVF
ncbi:MAG TPA: M28 family metallopeptidase [Pseudonocardiaceae bacterium]|nr:M28 family metallopeptidase [Pseudonocardiaceae bacterium]